MKATIISTIILIFTIAAFSQPYRTHLIKTNTEGNFVKELYLVRDTERDIMEGMYQQFFLDTLITRGRYANNKKTGLWEFFDYSDKLNFSGYYINDVKDGKWVYYLNNIISAEVYYSIGKTDSIFGFFENGLPACEVRMFDDGRGVIKTYYDNGMIKEVQPTKSGKPDGIYQVYFKNGQLHRKVLYTDAQIKSVISTFDMSGNAIDGGSLKDGNGNFIAFFIYDTPEIVPMKKYRNLGIKNDELAGIGSNYYENGKLESSGFIENGNTIGEWKYYKKDGSIKHIINYDYSPFLEKRRHLIAEIYSGSGINTGERTPEFQGGEEKWLKFLVQTVHYPNEAGNIAVLGIVYVDFVVSDVGWLQSSRVVKSISKPLDDEALRVTKQMPRWNPGLRYGIPVRFKMNMPLSFNIE